MKHGARHIFPNFIATFLEQLIMVYYFVVLGQREPRSIVNGSQERREKCVAIGGEEDDHELSVKLMKNCWRPVLWQKLAHIHTLGYAIATHIVLRITGSNMLMEFRFGAP